MPPIGRILKGIAVAVPAAIYVWFASVRAVGRVKRKKARRGIGVAGRRR